VLQAFVGVALGFLTYLFFAAIQAAGDLVDLFGGFTVAQAYDPLSMTQNSIFGRLHQLLATTLLFASNGHLLIIRGFLSSYDAVPVDAGLDLSRLGSVLTSGITTLFVSALQIAGPLIGVLFVADMGLGLLTRVSPSLQAFSMGFPIKILLTLLLIGFTFPLLPQAVGHLADLGTRTMMGVLSG
jgi:flagellar biosynthesis protein FliR